MRLQWASAACVAAVLAAGGCGDGGDAETQQKPSPDPAMERLAAACTEYREATSAGLPPGLARRLPGLYA